MSESALGLSERTGIMGVHSDAGEGTVMLRVGEYIGKHECALAKRQKIVRNLFLCLSS